MAQVQDTESKHSQSFLHAISSERFYVYFLLFSVIHVFDKIEANSWASVFKLSI